MSEPIVLAADQVDPNLLKAFLCKVYSPLKCNFLNAHGQWWNQSNKNRLIIQLEGNIIGYCAIIPTRTYLTGHVQSALWKIDLIIDPNYRGRGFQKLFDRRVQEMAELLLGFPNAGISSRVHRKLGWNVREDARILLLPLSPQNVKTVCSAKGLRGTILRCGALVLSPLAASWRTRIANQQPEHVWKMVQFDGEILSKIFMQSKRDVINTTWRDRKYFEWRYGAAPQPQEYSYYLAGSEAAPSHYLIARHLTQGSNLRYTRILDLFGDFNDTSAVRNLLTLAVQDAISRKSGQVTLLASIPELRLLANHIGFLFSSQVNFCWLSKSTELMSALAGLNYWTLADSDNDAPD